MCQTFSTFFFLTSPNLLQCHTDNRDFVFAKIATTIPAKINNTMRSLPILFQQTTDFVSLTQCFLAKVSISSKTTFRDNNKEVAGGRFNMSNLVHYACLLYIYFFNFCYCSRKVLTPLKHIQGVYKNLAFYYVVQYIFNAYSAVNDFCR